MGFSEYEKALKMKLSTFVVFASSCRAAEQLEEMTIAEKRHYEFWRDARADDDCRRANCQDECRSLQNAMELDQEPCFTCCETFQCPLFDLFRNTIECMKESCREECKVSDLACDVCTFENCDSDSRQLAILDKVTGLGEKIDVSAEDNAYRRCGITNCAMDCIFCIRGNYAGCEGSCQACISKNCDRAE